MLSSCSKNKGSVPDVFANSDWCGTVSDNSWMKGVHEDSLTGNWEITYVAFSEGTGSSITLYDTVYHPFSPITFFAGGSGNLNGLTVSWTLDTSYYGIPRLTITNLDTLFPFATQFDDTARIFLQFPPSTAVGSGFYAWGREILGNNWEDITITFKRQ